MSRICPLCSKYRCTFVSYRNTESATIGAQRARQPFEQLAKCLPAMTHRKFLFSSQFSERLP